MATRLEVGDKAPAFSLKDQAGKAVGLADYKGRRVVLYFYPKDDTPGCTKESCSLRDNNAAIEGLNAEVIGVSADGQASHEKFIGKFNLPFTLLSDTDHSVMESYGAFGEKNLYGKIVQGVLRSTFVIDEEGKIAHIFRKVRTDTHGEDVVKVLGEL